MNEPKKRSCVDKLKALTKIRRMYHQAQEVQRNRLLGIFHTATDNSEYQKRKGTDNENNL